jgi:hypothetical protein
MQSNALNASNKDILGGTAKQKSNAFTVENMATSLHSVQPK